jgi:sugar phosphate isomerase/epimerase
MDIGLLTAPLGDMTLDRIASFARDKGFRALEVAAGPGSNHLDTANADEALANQVRELVDRAGVRISSLAWYTNLLDPDQEKRLQMIEQMKAVIATAAALEVPVVCTLAGMPLPGKDRMSTIEQDFRSVFEPLTDYAGERGIKIAFENWFATNIQNLAHWERVFDVVPAPNLGLNYDPSHLLWQGIDHLEAIDQFRDRIFHAHAKDTEVKQHVLRRLGNQSMDWWRYCIPGYGEVDWGVLVARLRDAGYDNVLSIEHEDRAFGVEEGFIRGQRHLSQYI